MTGNLEETYVKLKTGDSLTDAELLMLIENHKAILKETDRLNDCKFDLFTDHLRSDLSRMEGYMTSRKRNK